MGDRASRDRVKRKRTRERAVTAFEAGNDRVVDQSVAASVTLHTSQITTLQSTTGTHTTQIAALQADDVTVDGRLDALEAPARVKAVRSGAQTAIVDSTPTFIDFNSTNAFDVGNWHDPTSGTLDVREKCVCPATGFYAIVADVEFSAHTHATRVLVEVTVGGTPDAAVLRDNTPSDASTAFAAQLTLVRALTAADAVKVRVTRVDLGGAENLDVNHASLTLWRLW